jgi:recombination protein RecR
VVEKASDIYSIERLGQYTGTYFVLHGVLSPIEGIGPEDIGVDLLLAKLRQQPPEELILALNPTVEGDATANYLTQKLSSLGLPISRLASGLPMGSELEFADQITLGKAFEGRIKLR